ncbi:hypothetical protein BGZ60DRAFT_469402 [Tricladium varicosporioides]|nr:hypothetical protein BGZ60DRAFT_469402 [Hymenoscyphus varicosporioides]
MADGLLDDIVQILRERDVPYDRDALKSALNDPEGFTAIKQWKEEYLNSDTLLTKEEAAQYAYLCKTGDAERLEAQDLSAVRGLDNSEIRDAIEELKRSTVAIEKQTETLRLQQNAMSALVKNGLRTSQARATTNKTRLTKWNVEKNHVSKAIEDLSQNLAYQISDLEQGGKASEAAAKQAVDGILKSDDKLLVNLQKLASDLDPINSGDEQLIARIRELCARLIKHTVEGIRTKLDRIYLEALGAPGAVNGEETESQESRELQEELESLYSEVLPVAQMSAEQQFLQPALRTLADTTGKGQERAAKAVKYIHECLIFLVSRLETLLAKAEESQCHKKALNFVLASAKAELSRVEAAPKITASPSKPNIQKRRTSSNPSPGRLRNARRRSSGVFENEDVDPEQQLARNLGITLPSEAASDHQRIETLERLLADRVLKLGIHTSSLQQTTELAISSYLQDANLTLQLLQDSLLAETLYGKVSLVDPDIESGVRMFEQEIQDLEQGLEEIDLGKLGERNVNKEQIIGRWSH